VIEAGRKESILIVGDPGAGKSAVISTAAQKLRSQGAEVIELAVDRLPVESADELQRQLGLKHAILEVLDNWPGNEPAFLFVDALDASRGGQGQRVFRWLMSEVLKLQRPRWRIIASIRSFDLRMGQELADLFSGNPPDANYAHRDFRNVKHILIPSWTEEELDQLLAQAEPIAKAIAVGGPKLRQLARTPFNSRLLADLLSRGAVRRVETKASSYGACLKWLTTEMQRSPHRRPKKRNDYLSDAKSKWPDLSKRRFYMAWQNAVLAAPAPAWSAAGAPKK
jgi:hypothetical protein